MEADYDHNTARVASSELFTSMINGEQVLKEARSNYLTTIYSQIIKESGKKFYLDKTTRNYLLISELKEVFPKAKFIFLTRNPISIFSSHLEYMVFNNWKWFSRPHHKLDLKDGYNQIAKGFKISKEYNFLVSYEDIVLKPENTLKKLCIFLKIEFKKEMIYYQDCLNTMKGQVRDPKSIHKHTKPVVHYLEAWDKIINTPFKLRIVKEFIEMIGSDVLNALGYSSKELIENLKLEDSSIDRFPNVSLQTLLTPWEKLTKNERSTLSAFFKTQSI